MKPEMIYLTEAQSSTASRITYDPALMVLTIEHRKPTKGDGTSVYNYTGVTAGEWRACTEAERPATWVRRNLVATKRGCVRLPGVRWCEACEDFARPTHECEPMAVVPTGISLGTLQVVTVLEGDAIQVAVYNRIPHEGPPPRGGVYQTELRRRYTTTNPSACRACGDDQAFGAKVGGRYLCSACMPEPVTRGTTPEGAPLVWRADGEPVSPSAAELETVTEDDGGAR